MFNGGLKLFNITSTESNKLPVQIKGIKMKYLLIALLLIGCGGGDKAKTETITKVETVVKTVIEYVEVEPKLTPKISLSFDDGEAVKYLYENRFLFLDRNITATMFVSRFGELSDYEKDMLVELQELGFEIGIHSEDHLNMVAYLPSYGADHYIKYEVERPLNQLKEIGIDAKSMAYPFGSYEGGVNDRINYDYNLRTRGFNTAHGVMLNQKGKFITAQSIDVGALTLEQAKEAIDKLTEKGGVIYLAGHVISNEYSTRFFTPAEYLIELIDYAQSKEIGFCNFSDC